MDEETILTKDDVEAMFAVSDFVFFWSGVDKWYSYFGFSDSLTDVERIAEYRYVHEQYRKYVGRAKDRIMSHDEKFNEMLDEIDDMISKADEKADERKKLVYIAMRDEWLQYCRNVISLGIEKDDEEVDYEW